MKVEEGNRNGKEKVKKAKPVKLEDAEVDNLIEDILGINYISTII